MAQHYLNQVASTWDRLDPCIPEPKMSKHSELKSFQISPNKDYGLQKPSGTFNNFARQGASWFQFVKTVFQISGSAACFHFHPSMGSCTQNAGFTASLWIPQRGRLPGQLGFAAWPGDSLP